MLEILLNHMNNFFERECTRGDFVVSGGTLENVVVMAGQYFLIKGSVFNDGLHQHGDILTDETFSGVVSLLAVPKSVKTLAIDIQAWEDKNGNSPYMSESFGGYSYSKDTEKNTWQKAFADRIRPYRKIVR